MTYNIHPLFVHFPIALLFVYSIIKIIPLQKWFPAVAWKHIERALLLVGVLGAFVALSTGETAEHLTRPNHDLVEAHALFATTATWMYGLLLAGEILSVIIPLITTKITSPKALKAITFIKDLLTHSILSTTLAVLGLLAISITGLLGGVMVYGTTADPVAAIVLKILGINY
ncbi:hypothetical protein K2Q02_00690 [Patescibacteria group bacterium]|nr:hypothetical protein [Patescibacteria group bacterium]